MLNIWKLTNFFQANKTANANESQIVGQIEQLLHHLNTALVLYGNESLSNTKTEQPGVRILSTETISLIINVIRGLANLADEVYFGGNTSQNKFTQKNGKQQCEVYYGSPICIGRCLIMQVSDSSNVYACDSDY